MKLLVTIIFVVWAFSFKAQTQQQLVLQTGEIVDIHLRSIQQAYLTYTLRENKFVRVYRLSEIKQLIIRKDSLVTFARVVEDSIHFREEKPVAGKVLEIDHQFLSYVLYENAKPYRVDLNQVSYVRYGNGVRENFNPLPEFSEVVHKSGFYLDGLFGFTYGNVIAGLQAQDYYKPAYKKEQGSAFCIGFQLGHHFQLRTNDRNSSFGLNAKWLGFEANVSDSYRLFALTPLNPGFSYIHLLKNKKSSFGLSLNAGAALLFSGGHNEHPVLGLTVKLSSKFRIKKNTCGFFIGGAYGQRKLNGIIFYKQIFTVGLSLGIQP